MARQLKIVCALSLLPINIFQNTCQFKGIFGISSQPRANGQPTGAAAISQYFLAPFKTLACISFYGTDVFHWRAETLSKRIGAFQLKIAMVAKNLSPLQ